MKIGFDFSTGKWTGLTIEYIEKMERLYPRIDLKQLLDELTQWLVKNEDCKKAHKKNFHKFLHNRCLDRQKKIDFGG